LLVAVLRSRCQAFVRVGNRLARVLVCLDADIARLSELLPISYPRSRTVVEWIMRSGCEPKKVLIAMVRGPRQRRRRGSERQSSSRSRS